jgi:hypothetical protein
MNKIGTVKSNISRMKNKQFTKSMDKARIDRKLLNNNQMNSLFEHLDSLYERNPTYKSTKI